MDYIEKRDKIKMIKDIPSEVLANFIVEEMKISKEKLEGPANESIKKYKYTDEYYESIFKDDQLIVDKLSRILDNDYLPTDIIHLKIPDCLKPYLNDIYGMYLPGGAIELRYRLPDSGVRSVKYIGNGKWKESTKELVIDIRTKIILDFSKYAGKEVVMFLRGYGPNKTNRYAVSMYFPSVKKIWTPDYKEIVKIIQELWYIKECNGFVKCIKEVLDGREPEYYEIDSQIRSKERLSKINEISKLSFRELFDKSIGFDSSFAFFPRFTPTQLLKLLSFVFKADDSGIYSRESSQIVLREGVSFNKSPEEAAAEERKFENKLKEDYIDNAIFDMVITILEQFLDLEKDMGKGDLEYPDAEISVEGVFIDELMLKGKTFIENAYKRVSYQNNRNYTDYKSLTLEAMCKIIADLVLENWSIPNIIL